ncbi:hypothetical protein MBLNU459_g2620t1 [Dothideomycetes sp. NU459]
METLLMLGHFCEIHGPQTVLCTQVKRSDAPVSSESGTSCANCSYNVPQTTTTPVLRSKCADNLTFVTSRITSDPLLRDAAVRALSVETLPKGDLSGPIAVDTRGEFLNSDNLVESYKAINIIHVFRIADPRARGQRRTYAFVAVGERASLWRHQHHIQRAFDAWARSIQHLAERHLRRLQKEDSAAASPYSDGSSLPPSATPSPPMSMESSGELQQQPFPAVPGHRVRQSRSGFSPASVNAKIVTPVSSFLSAKTVDPDGYPRSSLSTSANVAHIPRTRSLADIVGDEVFFVRLHKEFCGLLKRLVESEGSENEEDGHASDAYASENGAENASDSGSEMNGRTSQDEEDEHGTNMLGSWGVDD